MKTFTHKCINNISRQQHCYLNKTMKLMRLIILIIARYILSRPNCHGRLYIFTVVYLTLDRATTPPNRGTYLGRKTLQTACCSVFPLLAVCQFCAGIFTTGKQSGRISPQSPSIGRQSDRSSPLARTYRVYAAAAAAKWN